MSRYHDVDTLAFDLGVGNVEIEGSVVDSVGTYNSWFATPWPVDNIQRPSISRRNAVPSSVTSEVVCDVVSPSTEDISFHTPDSEPQSYEEENATLKSMLEFINFPKDPSPTECQSSEIEGYGGTGVEGHAVDILVPAWQKGMEQIYLSSFLPYSAVASDACQSTSMHSSPRSDLPWQAYQHTDSVFAPSVLSLNGSGPSAVIQASTSPRPQKRRLIEETMRAESSTVSPPIQQRTSRPDSTQLEKRHADEEAGNESVQTSKSSNFHDVPHALPQPHISPPCGDSPGTHDGPSTISSAKLGKRRHTDELDTDDMPRASPSKRRRWQSTKLLSQQKVPPTAEEVIECMVAQLDGPEVKASNILRIVSVGEKLKYACIYHDPVSKKPCSKTGQSYVSERNFRRHVTGTHCEKEEQDILEGRLKEEDAVALKFPWCHGGDYICDLEECGYYKKNGKKWTCLRGWKRDDRVVSRHKKQYHLEEEGHDSGLKKREGRHVKRNTAK